MNFHDNPGRFQTQMSEKSPAATDREVLPLSQRRTGDGGSGLRGGACRGSTSPSLLVRGQFLVAEPALRCHGKVTSGSDPAPTPKTTPGRDLRVSSTVYDFTKDLHIPSLISVSEKHQEAGTMESLLQVGLGTGELNFVEPATCVKMLYE